MQHSTSLRHSQNRLRYSRERAVERHFNVELLRRTPRQWQRRSALRKRDVSAPLEWDVSVGTSTGQVFGSPDFVPPVGPTRLWSSTVRRRPRPRRSHRVVRAGAKTAGGGSGDPDPEPPRTRRTATIGGVP